MSERVSPSRRALLRAAASGGIAAALSAACGRARGADRIRGQFVDGEHAAAHRWRDGALPSAVAGRSERARVLIVGGGAAGSSAAWRLAREGVDGVVLLELGADVGGTSRGGQTAGLAHPWGAHYLPVPRRSQRALTAFLVEAGLAQLPQSGERLLVPDEALVRAPDERLFTLGHWEEGLWPRGGGAKGEDEAARARFEALVDSYARLPLDPEGRRAFDLPLAHTSAAARALDNESAADFAARHGLTGERIRWWLEYATRDDFGAALGDTSAYALVHYFAARAAVTGDTVEEPGEYMTWPEGNQRLVRALHARAVDTRTSTMATSVTAFAGGVEVESIDIRDGSRSTWRAERVILATPQFLNLRLLREDPARASRATFRYGPWVVANLDLPDPPPERGFPRAWDNVRYLSPSLGYVDATHQLDRAERSAVWTWYLPVTDRDERAARAALLSAPWEHFRDLVLTDLRGPHPDLCDRVRRIDVFRHAHAMVRPSPGWLWGPDRARAAESFGGVHFANTDLAGLALFEEAHWHGTRAAEEVMAGIGVDFEALA